MKLFRLGSIPAPSRHRYYTWWALGLIIAEALWPSLVAITTLTLIWMGWLYLGGLAPGPGRLIALGLLLVYPLGRMGWQISRLWRDRHSLMATSRRRLEKRSNLDHQPLDTLNDHNLSNHPKAHALWHVHQKQARHQLEHNLDRPFFNWQQCDRWGGRYIIPVIGIAIVTTNLYLAKGDWWPSSTAIPRGGVVFTLTPPPQTALEPTTWRKTYGPDSSGQAKEITAPAGSMLKIVWSPTPLWLSPKPQPRIAMGGNWFGLSPIRGEDNPPSGDTSFMRQIRLATSDTMDLVDGNQIIFNQPIRLVANDKPVINKLDITADHNQATLRIDWDAQDDYSLKRLTITLAQNQPFWQHHLWIGPGPIDRRQTVIAVGHLAQAGQPANVIVSLTDSHNAAAEHTATELVLPRYPFKSRDGQKIQAIRRHLMAGNDRRDAFIALQHLAQDIRKAAGDPIIYLALVTAAADVRDRNNVESVIDTLWPTALRAESEYRQNRLLSDNPAWATRAKAEQAILDALATDDFKGNWDVLIDQWVQSLADSLGMEPGQAGSNTTQIAQDLAEILRQYTANGDRQAVEDIFDNIQSELAMMEAEAESINTIVDQQKALRNQSQQALGDLKSSGNHTITDAGDQQQAPSPLDPLIGAQQSLSEQLDNSGIKADGVTVALEAMIRAAKRLKKHDENALDDQQRAIDALSQVSRQHTAGSRIFRPRSDPSITLPNSPHINSSGRILRQLHRRLDTPSSSRHQRYLEQLLETF